MFGEKYINRDAYLNGSDGGDNECMYIGDNPDITRWTGTETAPMPPLRDRSGSTNFNFFGRRTRLRLIAPCATVPCIRSPIPSTGRRSAGWEAAPMAKESTATHIESSWVEGPLFSQAGRSGLILRLRDAYVSLQRADCSPTVLSPTQYQSSGYNQTSPESGSTGSKTDGTKTLIVGQHLNCGCWDGSCTAIPGRQCNYRPNLFTKLALADY